MGRVDRVLAEVELEERVNTAFAVEGRLIKNKELYERFKRLLW